MSAAVVRERADPRRLALSITDPSGVVRRWGPDESDGRNVPTALTFGTRIPGGYATLDTRLERRGDQNWPDLKRFSPCRCYGAGGTLTAWEGYLSGAGSSRSDDYTMTPSFVGWAASMKDNPNISVVYIDRNPNNWVPQSLQRSINIAATPRSLANASVTVVPDKTGSPGWYVASGGPINKPTAEQWYDAKLGKIGRVRATVNRVNLGAADPNNSLQFFSANDDVNASVSSPSFIDTQGLADWIVAVPTRFVAWQWFWAGTAGGTAGSDYGYRITNPSVIGDHGLTLAGLDSTQDGFYPHDVLGHMIDTFCPLLTRDSNSIRPDTSFVIPQLAFQDPVDADSVVSALNRMYLNDWGVYDHQKFFWRPAGSGRTWYLNIKEAVQPDDHGDQIETAFNGAIVRFTDPGGVTRTAGPLGSGADYTDASLSDASAANPVNAFGRKRWALIDVPGVQISAGAIRLGAIFLVESATRGTSGQCRVTGFAADSFGREWPVWMMRAGDSVVYTDTGDFTPHVIIDTSYNHDSLELTASLDAPPNKLDWLIERLQVVIEPLG